MKKILLLPLVFLLLSCATGTFRSTAENGQQIPVTQESVVSYDFNNSVIFRDFARMQSDGPIIPGLTQQLVPQGMACFAEEDLMIISCYMSDGSAGALSVVDMETGLLQKVLYLYNGDNTPHTGHLGGLAASKEHLWIASDPGIYPLARSVVTEAEDNARILLPSALPTETNAMFATSTDGVLWIGEFTRSDGNYPTDPSHHVAGRDGKTNSGWLGGYALEEATDLTSSSFSPSDKLQPDVILSIPFDVQGAVIHEDYILLSTSYGRKNNSRLLVYENPLKQLPHTSAELASGKSVGIWFLDDLNFKAQISLPPMSEALVWYEQSIAVLFESAAEHYRSSAYYPVDRIQLLGWDFITAIGTR